MVRLVAEPLPEVAVNVVGPAMNLLMRKPVIGLSVWVTLKVLHQPRRELLSVFLNQLDQPSGKHPTLL
jgi:hypothetical protein